ncbi:MAG: exodeoxyribonuclease III [bacterium]|nr:exodeoxyribonuclease III [bacterium]
MKIATWNVNSIKARLPNVLQWLKQEKPDIACLQELKCVDDAFPRLEIEELGYNVTVHGQKTYNGVAILSKLPFDEVSNGLPGDESDEQARYVEASISTPQGALRIASIYLPNGNPVETPKYEYKLAWMDRLIAHTKTLLSYEESLVLAGDYNVIIGNEDCYNPEAWRGDALFRPETAERFQRLVNLGLTNSFKACNAQGNLYSFWDYQAGAWEKDNGILIDHLLLSPQAADKLHTSEIDKFTRDWERPSDHVPVWIELDMD